MNKRKVDELIPRAYDVLKEVEIVENGKVKKAWRGQISSFGASVATGSLLAAVAFFSNKSGADVDRPKLLRGIEKLLRIQTGLKAYLSDKSVPIAAKKERIMEAAVALKLAMNLYELEDPNRE